MTKKHWLELVGPGKAFHISRNLYDRRRPLPLHDHDFAELFWIGSGGAGKHTINGATMKLSAGALVMLLPSDRHGYAAIGGGGLRMFNLGFPRGYVARMRRRYFHLDNRWFGREGKLPLHLFLDADQLGMLGREYRWLCHAPRDLQSIDTFCLNLMRILGPPSGALVAASSTPPPWLDAAMRRFSTVETFHETPTLRRFFQLAGRSPEHVARVMRATVGMSPSSWVNHQRVGYAARLLETTDLPVLEVALECGFESPSYFHRLFRRRFGASPRKHRYRHGTSL